MLLPIPIPIGADSTDIEKFAEKIYELGIKIGRTTILTEVGPEIAKLKGNSYEQAIIDVLELLKSKLDK